MAAARDQAGRAFGLSFTHSGLVRFGLQQQVGHQNSSVLFPVLWLCAVGLGTSPVTVSPYRNLPAFGWALSVCVWEAVLFFILKTA